MLKRVAAPITGNRETQAATFDMESAVQKNTTTSGRPAERGDRVLCLDGGGMRGLIHTTILKKLEHDLGINPDDASGPRLRDYFDWICGTSTGALLGGLLATGKTAQDGELLYQRFKEGCNTGSTKERSSALRKALLNEFGEELKMTELTGWRSEKLKVIVTGVLADRLPTKLHLFRSYETDRNDYDSDHHQFAPTTPPHKQPVWEALLASAAAPYYFLPCGNFIDGGLMANNPTLDVLAEINEYNKARGRNFIDNRPIDVVLSLGTGVPRIEKEELPVFHLQESTFQKLTSPLQNVANLKSLIRLGEINLSQATQTTRQVVHRCKNWCSMIGASFYRFSPKLDTVIPMDCRDQKILEMMMKHSEQYIYSHRESIDDLVRKLRR